MRCRRRNSTQIRGTLYINKSSLGAPARRSGMTWLQIIAGWLLSAIFVAGVTGLMKTS
jgi:hypothetical protein